MSLDFDKFFDDFEKKMDKMTDGLDRMMDGLDEKLDKIDFDSLPNVTVRRKVLRNRADKMMDEALKRRKKAENIEEDHVLLQDKMAKLKLIKALAMSIVLLFFLIFGLVFFLSMIDPSKNSNKTITAPPQVEQPLTPPNPPINKKL